MDLPRAGLPDVDGHVVMAESGADVEGYALSVGDQDHSIAGGGSTDYMNVLLNGAGNGMVSGMTSDTYIPLPLREPPERPEPEPESDPKRGDPSPSDLPPPSPLPIPPPPTQPNL